MNLLIHTLLPDLSVFPLGFFLGIFYLAPIMAYVGHLTSKSLPMP
jgi:hypothetical protein